MLINNLNLHILYLNSLQSYIFVEISMKSSAKKSNELILLGCLYVLNSFTLSTYIVLSPASLAAKRSFSCAATSATSELLRSRYSHALL